MHALRIAVLILLFTLTVGCARAPHVPDVALPAADAPATPAPTAVPTATAAVMPTAAPTPARVPANLYVPDAARDSLVCIEGTIAEDSPLALIDALVSHGAIPDVDYGRNLYFTVGDSFVKVRNKVRKPAVVARLDVGGAFYTALTSFSQHDEELMLQSLANTFIDYYGAETFMMTIEGVKLETGARDYERGVTFDQYIKTIGA